MTDYTNSKIYKIEPINMEDEGDIYIGSTTKSTLAQRMTFHRYNYDSWKNTAKGYTKSFDLFDKYGINNCKIYLIENFPCKTKDELRSREGHYIRTLKCLNKYISGRTKEQWNLDNKDYYKNYGIIHRNENNEYQKIRYKNSPKVFCGCGKFHKKQFVNNHKKTRHHKQYETLMKNVDLILEELNLN